MYRNVKILKDCMIYTYVHSCSYGSEDSHKQNRLACFRNQPFHVILEFLSSNPKKFLLPKKLSFQSILKVYCNFFFYKLIFNITCIDKMIARTFIPFLLMFINMQAKQVKQRISSSNLSKNVFNCNAQKLTFTNNTLIK